MPRGNGGIIGPVNTSFSGVWSLTEAQLRRSGGTWPNFYAALLSESATGSDAFTVGATADPYFEYTTLLLPGNGTNGAQNNTFLDGSTNNFTITRNGNTTQGTFSPFSQTGWGNYFNGSSSYLSGDGSSGLALSTGDFTIELWVFANSFASLPQLISFNPASTNGAYPLIYINSSGSLIYYVNNSTAITGGSVSTGVWHHVALARSGTSTKMFLNGTQVGSTYSDTNNYLVGASRPNIGKAGFNDSSYLNGYISNLRVVKGTAVYTSNFTPPTTPLTAITNTQLLTCQSNRFIDTNTQVAAKTITATGSPTVVAFSPFNPTASWSAATYGGSGYFDGSGDYLSVADNTNLRFGTNAFTIQAWVYRNASGAAHSIISKGGASTGYVLQVTSTNVLRFTHGTTNVDTTTTIPASAWTHVAAVRTNTSTNGFQLYINGVSSATATVATDFNQTDTLYIGSDRSAANVMNGYISGLKYTNGTAESISVPTEPPTATTNVALLTNFTNAGIYDATSKNDLETVGNAQISTTQSKWGGSSMSFDGTGDYLNTLSTWAISGSEAYTLEAWIYPTTVSGDLCIYETRSSSGTGFVLFINSTGKLQVYDSTGLLQTASTTTLTANTWTYIAMVRSAGSSTNTYYVNGTSAGTFTLASFAAATNARIGARNDGVAAYNGYMQDFRITKGYGRYTANFTPPTAAFPTL